MYKTKRQRYIRELNRATLFARPGKMIEVSVEAAKEIRELLEEQEQPVRCAECRFYEKHGAPGGLGWCSRPGAGCGQPADFWCAGAKRKEEDGAETD